MEYFLEGDPDLRGRPGPRLAGDLDAEREGDPDLRGRPGPRLAGDLDAEREGDLEADRDSDLRPGFFLHDPSLRTPRLHVLEGDPDLRGRPGPRLEGDLEAERERDSDLRPGFFLHDPS